MLSSGNNCIGLLFKGGSDSYPQTTELTTGSPSFSNFSLPPSPSLSTTMVSPGKELARQQPQRQRILNQALDRAPHRPRAVRRIVAVGHDRLPSPPA